MKEHFLLQEGCGAIYTLEKQFNSAFRTYIRGSACSASSKLQITAGARLNDLFWVFSWTEKGTILKWYNRLTRCLKIKTC